ncbi:PREDICTED: protein FAR1-RELATED SEQUENCE 2 [Tarenaya hassleriana]|uniref:protein FAR1-RELATED SEQUENCE 2 n=1 Tax=Tarenaya hassleriana TaxID=28532 RepID=UPI00053C55C9|nr:PREDICTED: protein FAR1-RELATED SEQUENCE 2 [Tarenaya hassleriana]XP_010522311.1 PREDICTED: protein FAR1-RELATED SEQUENCE 2 [Tarenaya hassleriana]XP_010522312.1 PREDICTED: protein FAR1-RELATED SEQUENCE 2 [Tarenaya hassleriana]XP_010522313.1 PREDICTED: protein FAR1-RELATED SEQUENCE 2 [Tarenaya hassleriana]
MEIDLEIPSYDRTLDSGSNVNADGGDSLDGMDVRDVEMDLPTRSGNAIEICEPSTSGSIGGSLEQFATVDDVNGGAINEPRNGLEFDSKEAAYYFYREYARSVGFGITIKASRRSKKSGKFIDVKIACSRFGAKRQPGTGVNPRSCPKTGCKAGMHMKRKEDEKWVICNFVKEHNHEICPDDFYIGVGGKKKQAGDVVHQKKGLQLALEVEDINLMLDHFMAMQEQQPGFFYAIDLDGEKHVRNVFWLDSKAKHCYDSFSDVVLFDTFYVRNGYKVPFAPFVGVSHHCQYVLLGCALIGEESASTFSWLFRTWLKAIGGQAPKVIITYQDKLLSEVIMEILPTARHCFCLWNLLGELPEKLISFVDQYDDFMKSFRECIHGSWTDEQFERRWSEMVGKFELNRNEWVLSLFNDRKKWAPHYFQGICLAGMSGHEKSGSIASRFDKHMDSEATFKDFFIQYTNFLRDTCDVEERFDLESQSRQPTLRSLSPFEKQLSLTYTDSAFKKFQAEVLGVVSCQLHVERKDGTNVIFHVEDFEERENFYVVWNKELLDVHCSCHLFELWGFLCKHAILVLQTSDVSSIPSQYILKRWSKNGNTSDNRNGKCDSIHSRMARFDDLCRRFVKLGEVASLSDEAYKTAFKVLEETLTHCVRVNNSAKFPPEPSRLMTSRHFDEGGEDLLDSTSRSSKKKKVHKKRKAYSGPEDTANRSQEHCQDTQEHVSYRAASFENCYIPRADMEEEPELGSRAATVGVYYPTPQPIQGFSSVPSIQDGYYGNPPAMQVMMGNVNMGHARMSQSQTQPSVQGRNFPGTDQFQGNPYSRLF